MHFIFQPTQQPNDPHASSIPTVPRSAGFVFWDLASALPTRILREAAGAQAAVTCLAFSADGQMLAAGSWDGMVTFGLGDPKGNPQVWSSLGYPQVFFGYMIWYIP